MLLARNIHYERADRDRAVACGGIGVTHLLAQRVGLPQDIDQHIHLLKRHLPYHESDHVLCLAYNILSGGTCIEDLELLRTNKAALDALGAQHIPDPTTAGDFCRRFENDSQVLLLMETLNEMRLKVGRQQEEKFFDQAVLDADGTIAPTTGQCKAGMDISYDGQWGYHPLLISLANSKEPLYLVNRPGNRPGHEQADGYLDKAITLCRRAEFQRILLRGDTDFTQTWKLDGWDQSGEVTLIFGADDTKPMEARAQALLPAAAAPGPVRGPDAATHQAPERERTDRPRATVQERCAAMGGCGRVRLPADLLPADLPEGGPAEEDLRGTGPGPTLRGIPMLLLHHLGLFTRHSG